jgi:hypothetical protein
LRKTGRANSVDFSVRVRQVFVIQDFTWDGIVKAVSDAAKAAGAGGVVILASGHGGAAPNDPNVGLINWDPTDFDPNDPHRLIVRSWQVGQVGKGLFWETDISKYTDVISPQSRPPTLKEEDEQNIRNKTQNSKILQMRHDAFDALQKIGKALQDNKVQRLTFTVCTAGAATNFMDKLAKHCHAQVACFKLTTMVLDDNTFGLTPGKARLILERDKGTDGRGTNILSARVFSPDLDDSSIAHVAKP